MREGVIIRMVCTANNAMGPHSHYTVSTRDPYSHGNFIRQQ